jgi:hypothetical protein
VTLQEGAPTVKTKVTLRIDVGLLRKAQTLAAREGASLDDLLTFHLERALRKRKKYQLARRSALARLKMGFDLGWTPPRSRDELHQRTSN